MRPKNKLTHVEARIFDELINILYRQASPIFFGNIAVASLSVFLLWHQVNRAWLLAWAAAIFILTAIRVVVIQRDLRTSAAFDRAHRRAWLYALLSGISGCLWGSVGILFFAPDNTVVTVFICILLAGMTGGSVASQSSFLPAYYAFAFPTVLPFAVRCFVYGESLFSVLGVLSLFLLSVNLAYSRNYQKIVRQTVALRFENMALIEQLQEEKERAEAANHSKSQFLAAASHDLRQPTHALGLYIATLRSLCEAPSIAATEVREVAVRLQNALKGLVQLLDALLDISRLDAGAVKVKQEVFDIADLLETLDQQFSAVALSKKLHLIVRPQSIWIKTDRSLLHSILTNFISNALRYTKRGKILVGIRRRANSIEVQVLDSGIGIAEHQLQAVFREFYQVGNAARQREHGLGLGLAIVKRAADLLQLEVGVRSILGRGSVFSVTLPIASLQIAQPAPFEERHPQSGKEILVLDDDIDVLDSMQLLLSAWGHRLAVASTLEQAVEVARQRMASAQPFFDVILSDFRLAENINGIDAVAHLRYIAGRDVPALIITGDTSTESLQCIAAAGLFILHKPLDAAILRNKLNALLV